MGVLSQSCIEEVIYRAGEVMRESRMLSRLGFAPKGVIINPTQVLWESTTLS